MAASRKRRQKGTRPKMGRHGPGSWSTSLYVLEGRIQRALDPRDVERRAGPCTVYNPDGTVREVLDPFTRKPIMPSPTRRDH